MPEKKIDRCSRSIIPDPLVVDWRRCASGHTRVVANLCSRLTGVPVPQRRRDRRGASAKTVDEMLGFGLQRILGRQVRSPHILSARTDPLLGGFFLETVQRYST